MSTRRLPVRPDLTQLKHQAKDLLHALRNGDPTAVDEFRAHNPAQPDVSKATLADAQFALARGYGVPSWARLVTACNVVGAIWADDLPRLRSLIEKRPSLLHEMARGTSSCNWGPPMSYAANLGRDDIIRMLWELGARDVKHAAGRATLQGHVATARMLFAMAGNPSIPKGAVMGPCEALNPAGLAFALEMGADISDGSGNRRAPVAMLLETYGRNPDGKHQCLDLLVKHGIELPDTAPMAVHRGRLDLLERRLHADPDLLRRTFAYSEIYPPEVGCHEDTALGFHGTPLGGATLLHMCIDYGELEIARWLVDRGMNVNARAAVDSDGFGGHTPLFATVVSYTYYVRTKYARRKPDHDPFADLLLDHGADPNARASLRTALHSDTVHEYRDVTPLGWGERFHDQALVSRPAMHAIASHGGRL